MHLSTFSIVACDTATGECGIAVASKFLAVGAVVPWAGHLTGEGYTCQGNILTGEAVVRAMAAAFECTAGPLPERLLAALAAGQAVGEDSRGQQSAALYVAKEKGSYGGYLDRYVDVRVDEERWREDEFVDREILSFTRRKYGF